jgi:hypothetical protein
MILYINGDSHSAGAEAVNRYCFAEDDPLYWALGRRPHPDNERASYGCEIANYLGAILHCEAESASSNQRIIRTTWDYLQGVQGTFNNVTPDYLIIGWSTWEREEWKHLDTYYQVTSAGTDVVPLELRTKYKEWVIEQDHITRERKLLQWHDTIYTFHTDLQKHKIPHLFFNTYSDFSNIRAGRITTHSTQTIPAEHDWEGCYIDPYDASQTYYNWCLANGFNTVRPNSYHFGADAHAAWAEYLLQFIMKKT